MLRAASGTASAKRSPAVVSIAAAAACIIIALGLGWLAGTALSPYRDACARMQAELEDVRAALRERDEILARMEQAGRVRVVWRGPSPPRDPFFGE